MREKGGRSATGRPFWPGYQRASTSGKPLLCSPQSQEEANDDEPTTRGHEAAINKTIRDSDFDADTVERALLGILLGSALQSAPPEKIADRLENLAAAVRDGTIRSPVPSS